MIGSRTFAPEAVTIREAREFVRHCLRESGADVDSAVLMTSELATNAVEHAESDYEVAVRHVDDAIRVEVRNDEPRTLPILATPEDTHGRGLLVVEALATRWGIESSDDRKVIWFEVANGR
jgi:anti-sigma regulatory factor (Ser/Thr protein kinase)